MSWLWSKLTSAIGSSSETPTTETPAAAAGSSASGASSGGGLISFGGKYAHKAQVAKKSTDYDLLFKVLIIGNSGVGKSCFITRFSDESFFTESYISTIGVDFKIKTVELNGRVVKLQLWDTAGQERYRTITSSYYRGAHGILCAYDITDASSFTSVPAWLTECGRYGHEGVSIMLLGMKADLAETKRAVSEADGRKLAADRGVGFSECSSKTNTNVVDSVLTLCRMIGRRLGEDLGDPDVAGTSAVRFGAKKAVALEESEVEAIDEEDLRSSMRSNLDRRAAAGRGAAARRARKQDVNVLRLGLESLSKPTTVMTGDPIFCMRCGSMMSSISKVEELTRAEAEARTAAVPMGPSFTPAPPIHDVYRRVSWVSKGKAPAPAGEVDMAEKRRWWTCDFCGAANDVSTVDDAEIPHDPAIDYVVQPAPAATSSTTAGAGGSAAPSASAGPPNIIFAIDVSGSMTVTCEIEGRHEFKWMAKAKEREREAIGGAEVRGAQRLPREKLGVTHVSRLNCLQTAIEAQIKKIARETPEKRVGLLTFSNEVTIIGDGTQEPAVLSGARLDSWEQLAAAGEKFKLEKNVREAEAGLLKRLWELEENGATALGPALRVAISMAGTAPGSSVIVCTDGMANQGLGSLEGRADTEMVAFYTEAGEQALLKGVNVSVLSLTGTDCRLEQLTVVAEKTGGKVDRVDPRKLTGELGAIVGAPEAIAFNGFAMVLLHRGLHFRGEADDEREQRFWIVRDIGNVTTASEVNVQYGFRPKEEIDLSAVKQIPFQVQIVFTRPDGAQMLRVATATIEATEDRAQAEKAANIGVVGAAAMAQAAKLAKAGDYEAAQLETRSAQRFLQRNVDDRAKLERFAEATESMDGAIREERDKVGADTKARQVKRGDAAAAAISQATQVTTKRLMI